ncbi:MAG: hypothetical protein WDN45_07125 [Caulobacteraceae bacterium]
MSDKTGLVETARALHDFGVELVSTGGTKAAIARGGSAGQGRGRPDRHFPR